MMRWKEFLNINYLVMLIVKHHHRTLGSTRYSLSQDPITESVENPPVPKVENVSKA